jgi:hypothetical protein
MNTMTMTIAAVLLPGLATLLLALACRADLRRQAQPQRRAAALPRRSGRR